MLLFGLNDLKLAPPSFLLPLWLEFAGRRRSNRTPAQSSPRSVKTANHLRALEDAWFSLRARLALGYRSVALRCLRDKARSSRNVDSPPLRRAVVHWWMRSL